MCGTLGIRPKTFRDEGGTILRSLRRSVEIAVLAAGVHVLRALQAARRADRRWLAAGAAAVLAPSVAVAAVVVPRAMAHPGASSARGPVPVGAPEPSPHAAVFTIDPSAFAAAARRPAATAPLPRLPQVDLAGLSVAGIPRPALAAYVTAAHALRRTDPSCHLPWWLLGGIGFVESGHAHSGGSADPRWNGIAHPPILGPRLDGKHGFAAIKDSDHGLFDQDARWDRAVGPMQFLPSTWRTWGGIDAHGRLRDPQDIRAAALAAGQYLCAASADLSHPQGLATAVYSYNHSFDYVRLVLSVAARYAGINPAALGVDRLPRDTPSKKKAGKPAATPSPTTSPTGSTTATGGSPSPSASPSPSPSPTGGGASLPPVPTPTPLGIPGS